MALAEEGYRGTHETEPLQAVRFGRGVTRILVMPTKEKHTIRLPGCSTSTDGDRVKSPVFGSTAFEFRVRHWLRSQLCTTTAVVIRLVSSERLENISPRYFQSRLNKTQNINMYCVVGYVRISSPYFFFSRLVGHGRRRGYELLVQHDVRSFRVSPGAAYTLRLRCVLKNCIYSRVQNFSALTKLSL